MLLFINHDGIQGDIDGCLARLELLVTDLTRIRDGRVPTLEALESSPFIDKFTVTTRRELSLIGTVTGHPAFDGPIITTSALWIVAPDLGWVRTFSRFYRLGREIGSSKFRGGA